MLHKGTNGIIQEQRAIRQNSVTHTVHDKSADDDYISYIIIILWLYSSHSENVRLLLLKAGRLPAEQRPRSPKARPVSETSAPGSTDTFSIYLFFFSFLFFQCSSWVWAKLISHSYVSNFLLSLSRVVLWNEKLKWLFFNKNSVIISFYTSSFNDTATIDFKTMYWHSFGAMKHKCKYISTSKKETLVGVKSNSSYIHYPRQSRHG